MIGGYVCILNHNEVTFLNLGVINSKGGQAAMVVPLGLEPRTTALSERCSDLLS